MLVPTEEGQNGVDVAERWNKHLQKTSVSYRCPFCSDRRAFINERRLLVHVQDLHPAELAPTGSAVDSAARWRQVADTAATAKPRQSGRGLHAAPQMSSPKQNAGVAAGRANRSSRPRSTGSLTRPAAGADVTVEPGSQTASPRLTIQRKRAAGGEAGPTEPGSTASPPRRSRARDRPASLDSQSDVARDWGDDDDDEVELEQGPRRPVAVGKRLFNPESDSPVRRPADGELGHRSRLNGPGAGAGRRRDPRHGRHEYPFRPRNRRAVASESSPEHGLGPGRLSGHDEAPEEHPQMIRQLDTTPISDAQLLAEAQHIYAAFYLVERKVIEVHQTASKTALTLPQYHALFALHRSLIFEIFDFLLATHHPQAGETLRGLATRYSIPARLWRWGIFSFLELLRAHLPVSLDHMISFTYLSYSIMALLYETVEAFRSTWTECLGDLGRYRLAIETETRDREVYASVSRHWYLKALDMAPDTGRLSHHLGILARPNELRQLFYYTRSMSAVVPFPSTRDSILSLLEPTLLAKAAPSRFESSFVLAHAILFTQTSLDRLDEASSRMVRLLPAFIEKMAARWKECGVYLAMANVSAVLGYERADHAAKRLLLTSPTPGAAEVAGASEESLAPASAAAPVTTEVSSNGLAAVVASAASRPIGSAEASVASSQSGVRSRPATPATTATTADTTMKEGGSEAEDEEKTAQATPKVEQRGAPAEKSEAAALAGAATTGEDGVDIVQAELGLGHVDFASDPAAQFFQRTFEAVLGQQDDDNVLPFVHICLTFLLALDPSASGTQQLARSFASGALARLMNGLLEKTAGRRSSAELGDFPRPEVGGGRPLLEDWMVRGTAFTARYFPAGWFTDTVIDEEERALELPSMTGDRQERILWIGHRLSETGHFLKYNVESQRFTAAS